MGNDAADEPHSHMTVPSEPGPLLASGRDADIFELTPNTVLRRARTGRSIAHEARIMQYVGERGYPVPRVDEIRGDGTEIVMERIDGSSMMQAIEQKPQSLFRNAALLADLHDQLHEIAAPDWLEPFDDGERVLHIDLHPLNVLMATRGPVVIDWGNAARGAPLTDVAMTYVLLVGPRMPAPWLVAQLLQPARQILARSFTRRYRGNALQDRIAFAAAVKSLDANLDDHERRKLQRIGRSASRRGRALG
jgi:aminoglycoside phosphotransferase (APT) family kinase protein